MIHVSRQHKVVALPYRADVANLFPHAKQIEHAGRKFTVLPHGVQETKVLRNLGIDAPAPILEHYEWPGREPPFDVQKKTCAMLSMNERAYVLNSMGTGKSRAALWAWDYLYSTGQAKKLLIVAPLSTLNFTWGREVFATLPHRKAVILHGAKAKRIKLLNDETADIFVVNHDGLRVLYDELTKNSRSINSICFDELAVYRNGRSERTKTACKVAAMMEWVWGMTGSPTPNAPTDAWGQCRIVTPATTPKFFTHFRDSVMYRQSQFKWLPKAGATEKVFQLMQPAVRFTLDDVIELPDVVERTIDIEMGAKQAKVYKSMKDEAYALVQSQQITAVNAGAVLNKLLQISTGWVYTSDKRVVPLDNEKRLEALVDIVLSTQNKVIVFTPFIHSLDGIRSHLTREGFDVATVSGATPKRERDEVFRLFQNTDKIKVLAAHPVCMAHGLTLTAADTIVWFAPITSLEVFEQACARIRRIGQKNKQQILMLQATDAERRIYTRLRQKQRVQNALLDLFEEYSTHGET